MGDLHSIPYFNSLPHNIQHASSSPYYSMDINDVSHIYDHSPVHSDDLSSGYLEDALSEFRSKRRRFLVFHDDQYQPSYLNSTTSFPSYCNSNSPQDIDHCYENFCKFYTDDNREERKVEGSGTEETNSTSSSETTKSSINVLEQTLLSSHSSFFTGGKKEERKRKLITRVVYPFAMVKPGGLKGDMTLSDINQRILMPPTRPLKHPVGDFACRPLVSPGGLGLSGKDVVALTRIHTQGRGTITIIRTKN
ncbi:hypothetical protein L2E82_49428 [Cichorium intybus]|uniref:Uncharacterized protein n=1 Tax=Cichorium intybus TaxID=13427 RepID=A0ACB8Z0V5_CICIN|nr:hypothetical protein L2E82_49428 [Cichorium intybus]